MQQVVCIQLVMHYAILIMQWSMQNSENLKTGEMLDGWKEDLFFNRLKNIRINRNLIYALFCRFAVYYLNYNWKCN